jgi:hypothetical protein
LRKLARVTFGDEDRSSTMPRNLIVAVLALAAFPAAAHAAAPANDDRDRAPSIDPLPANVKGTTAQATLDKTDPPQGCSGDGPDVWYRFTAAAGGRVVVELQADGDLDAVIVVYRRVRSQTNFADCDASDDKGAAATDIQAAKGETYLVRVSQRANSVPGTFTLRVSAPIAPARPPGARLPAAGVTRTLDRADNTDDAWSATFRAGMTYRLHLSGRGGRCATSARVYAPGISSFADGRVVRSVSCGGYVVFTPEPGAGGRYPIRVQANRGVRGEQRYHLEVARAGRDDTAPGIFVRNHARVRGGLRGGGIDVVDLYRFDVTGRSVTFLDLSAPDGFSLQLLDERGRRLASGADSIHRGTRPGRYFVAVRAGGNATGRYTLRRGTRVITRTLTTLTGGLGGLRATATTTPASPGRYVITVERFDPLAGWLFAKRATVTGGGTASAAYVPPGPGRYRARAAYVGTRDAAPSTSRWAYVTAGGPLQQ